MANTWTSMTTQAYGVPLPTPISSGAQSDSSSDTTKLTTPKISTPLPQKAQTTSTTPIQSRPLPQSGLGSISSYTLPVSTVISQTLKLPETTTTTSRGAPYLETSKSPYLEIPKSITTATPMMSTMSGVVPASSSSRSSRNIFTETPYSKTGLASMNVGGLSPGGVTYTSFSTAPYGTTSTAITQEIPKTPIVDTPKALSSYTSVVPSYTAPTVTPGIDTAYTGGTVKPYSEVFGSPGQYQIKNYLSENVYDPLKNTIMGIDLYAGREIVGIPKAVESAAKADTFLPFKAVTVPLAVLTPVSNFGKDVRSILSPVSSQSILETLPSGNVGDKMRAEQGSLAYFTEIPSRIGLGGESGKQQIAVGTASGTTYSKLQENLGLIAHTPIGRVLGAQELRVSAEAQQEKELKGLTQSFNLTDRSKAIDLQKTELQKISTTADAGTFNAAQDKLNAEIKQYNADIGTVESYTKGPSMVAEEIKRNPLAAYTSQGTGILSEAILTGTALGELGLFEKAGNIVAPLASRFSPTVQKIGTIGTLGGFTTANIYSRGSEYSQAESSLGEQGSPMRGKIIGGALGLGEAFTFLKTASPDLKTISFDKTKLTSAENVIPIEGQKAITNVYSISAQNPFSTTPSKTLVSYGDGRVTFGTPALGESTLQQIKIGRAPTIGGEIGVETRPQIEVMKKILTEGKNPEAASYVDYIQRNLQSTAGSTFPKNFEYKPELQKGISQLPDWVSEFQRQANVKAASSTTSFIDALTSKGEKAFAGSGQGSSAGVLTRSFGDVDTTLKNTRSATPALDRLAEYKQLAEKLQSQALKADPTLPEYKVVVDKTTLKLNLENKATGAISELRNLPGGTPETQVKNPFQSQIQPLQRSIVEGRSAVSTTSAGEQQATANRLFKNIRVEPDGTVKIAYDPTLTPAKAAKVAYDYFEYAKSTGGPIVNTKIVKALQEAVPGLDIATRTFKGKALPTFGATSVPEIKPSVTGAPVLELPGTLSRLIGGGQPLTLSRLTSQGGAIVPSQPTETQSLSKLLGTPNYSQIMSTQTGSRLGSSSVTSGFSSIGSLSPKPSVIEKPSTVSDSSASGSSSSASGFSKLLRTESPSDLSITSSTTLYTLVPSSKPSSKESSSSYVPPSIIPPSIVPSSSSFSTSSWFSSSSSSSSSFIPSSSSSSSSSGAAGIRFGAGFPSLGSLPGELGTRGPTGSFARSGRENFLRNFFFEKLAPEKKAQTSSMLPVKKPTSTTPQGELKFKLKITDMMGTTLAKKSGKIGKSTKSLSIRTPQIARSEGVKNRIVMNTTPFNIKDHRWRV